MELTILEFTHQHALKHNQTNTHKTTDLFLVHPTQKLFGRNRREDQKLEQDAWHRKHSAQQEFLLAAVKAGLTMADVQATFVAQPKLVSGAGAGEPAQKALGFEAP